MKNSASFLMIHVSRKQNLKEFSWNASARSEKKKKTLINRAIP